MPPQFLDTEFETILSGYRLEQMHASDETIYALRPDLTLAYFNQGWSKFAEENGGQPSIAERWPLGRSIGDAIPAILRPFFFDRFARCLQTGSPWQHRYECSSRDAYREYMMTTYPLGRHQGLLVINSLFKTSTQRRPAQAPVEGTYCDENGMIVQCVHCRRIRRPSLEAVWDWVPAWVYEHPENMSHGLCEPCYGYFYPNGLPRAGGYPKFFRTETDADEKVIADRR